MSQENVATGPVQRSVHTLHVAAVGFMVAVGSAVGVLVSWWVGALLFVKAAVILAIPRIRRLLSREAWIAIGVVAVVAAIAVIALAASGAVVLPRVTRVE